MHIGKERWALELTKRFVKIDNILGQQDRLRKVEWGWGTVVGDKKKLLETINFMIKEGYEYNTEEGEVLLTKVNFSHSGKVRYMSLMRIIYHEGKYYIFYASNHRWKRNGGKYNTKDRTITHGREAKSVIQAIDEIIK